MNRNRTAALFCAFSALASSPVLAADLPGRAPAIAPPSVYVSHDWTGFYVGAHAGVANARDKWNFIRGAGNVVWAFDGDRFASGNSGFLGGLQAGYMQQFGSLVAGVDISGSFGGASKSSPGPFAPTFHTYGFKQQGLGLAQGRLGIAASSNILFFGQAGLAVTEHTLRLNSVFAGFNNDSAKAMRTGWTVGAGLNYKLTQNWILGVEYNYIDFGGRTFTFTNNGVPAHIIRSNKTDHVGKLTLNYQFGSSIMPVVAKY